MTDSTISKSQERKKERNKRNYEKIKANASECEACSRKVNQYYWKSHVETNRHKKLAELLEASKQVAEEPIAKKKRGRPPKILTAV